MRVAGLAAAVVALAAGVAMGEEAQAADPLAGLTQPVTLVLEQATIGQALAALNAQTGVGLMAALPAERVPISLAVTERPLGEVLRDLAEMCGLKWHVGGALTCSARPPSWRCPTGT